MWFHFAWLDPRSVAVVKDATANWASEGTCNRPCDWSNTQTSGCCDGLWLPNIEVASLINLQSVRAHTYARLTRMQAPSDCPVTACAALCCCVMPSACGCAARVRVCVCVCVCVCHRT